MNKPLNEILLYRFDVSIENQDELQKAHKNFFGTLEYWEMAKTYFGRRFEEITSQLDSDETVFLTYIFHIVSGYYLTFGEPEPAKIQVLLEYIDSLRDELGGYFPVNEGYIKQFPKLGASSNTPIVPEVYTSYYGFWTERILNYTHSPEQIDGLLSWVIACQQTSGLIYNPAYSNTLEGRRFESEMTAQLYYAIELLLNLQSNSHESGVEISFNSGRDWIINNFIGLKSIAGRYFALKALSLISPDEVCNLGTEELRGFVNDRLSNDTDGYYDYRLADKIDESMSSRSYIKDDINTSHVFSTYYALAMLRIIDNACGGSSEVSEDSVRLLVERSKNSDGGFGRHVRVKAFPTPFGPDTTDLETLLVALIPTFFI